MENEYKSALDKITLRKSEKEKAKALFRQADADRPGETVERRNIMRLDKFLRGAAVVAAGLVIVLGVNAVIPALTGHGGDVSGTTLVDRMDDVSESASVTGLPKAENRFSMVAYNKELTEGGKVFSNDHTSYGYEFLSDDKNRLSFCFEFPVECKGENIDSITYHIDSGVFRISNAVGKGVVVDGEKADSIVRNMSKINVSGEETEAEQYKSFTVKYDNQMNDTTYIEIADTWKNWSKDKFDHFKAFDFDIIDLSRDERSLEKRKEVYDFLTKDMGITCTVTFNDGTTESRNVKVSNEIVKLSEVLLEEDIPGDDRMDVVRCFSIR